MKLIKPRQHMTSTSSSSGKGARRISLFHTALIKAHQAYRQGERVRSSFPPDQAVEAQMYLHERGVERGVKGAVRTVTRDVFYAASYGFLALSIFDKGSSVKRAFLCAIIAYFM